MTETNAELPSVEAVEVANGKPRSLWWYAWRRLRKNRLAMVGLCVITIIVLTAIFADFIAPMPPNRQVLEFVRKPIGFRGQVLAKRSHGGTYAEEYIAVRSFTVQGDSVRYTDYLNRTLTIARSSLVGTSEKDWHRELHYILGTDDLGRDELSRLVFGARVSMMVGLVAELLSLSIGVVLGALAGYFRGWVDGVVMYMANVIWSFPFILLVIALSIAWGWVWNSFVDVMSPLIPALKDGSGGLFTNAGFWQAFISIGIANWVDTARIVRGQFFSLRETEYVEATRAIGFGPLRTIFRHMLPNALGPITVVATAGFASAIIAEAGLAYVGMGVQLPMSSWGAMVNAGYGNIMANSNWGLAIFPSVAIALAVFSINMLGDGLRDALDPRLKR